MFCFHWFSLDFVFKFTSAFYNFFLSNRKFSHYFSSIIFNQRKKFKWRTNKKFAKSLIFIYIERYLVRAGCFNIGNASSSCGSGGAGSICSRVII